MSVVLAGADKHKRLKMKNHWMRTASLAVMFLTTAIFAAAAKAEAPDPAVQQVQTFYDTLLDAMKHSKELGIKGRYDKLKPVVEQTFDLPDMVRVAVGPSWATMPAPQQQALLAAFERMTVAQYANNFDGYSGEKFIVEPATQPRGQDRVVLSKLVSGSQTVAFYYVMRQTTGGTWKIFTILLNGTINQLAVQRSEYAATLAVGGGPGLEKKLNALADKLMGS